MRRKSLVIIICFFILAVALLVAIGPMEISLNRVAAHFMGATDTDTHTHTQSAAVSAVSSVSSASSTMSSTEPTAIPTPEAEVLPMYPGARVVAVAPEHQVPNATVTAYEVYAADSDVMAFYKSELGKKGWSVRLEAPSRQLSMVWFDSSGTLPWGLDIDMPLSSEMDSVQNRVETSWSIYLRRVPIPENVPAYPGATPVAPDPAATERYSDPRIIYKVYVTSASLSEVEAYYTQVLPECGWIRQEPKDADITEGLGYAFRRGTVYDVRTAYLAVQAKSLPDGTTQIEVRSAGNTNSK